MIDPALDDDGVNERLIRDMAFVRAWLFRFVERNPPGLLVYGISNDDLRDVVRQFDVALVWLQQARDCAERERRRRRVKPSPPPQQ